MHRPCVAQNYDPLAEADNGTCQYETVLQLDMGDLPVDPAGVHVAGSFQSLGAHGHADGTWDGQHLPYNGGRPSGIEGAVQIPERQRLGHGRGRACRLRGVNGFGGFNRAFVVPAANTTLEVHCFSSCTTCTPAGPVDCTAGDCCGEGTVWDAASGTCVSDGTSAPTCVEDLNGDGTVAVSDILQLLGAFWDGVSRVMLLGLNP